MNSTDSMSQSSEFLPMLATDAGITIYLTWSHESKAQSLITLTVSGIDTEVRLWHPYAMLFSMTSTPCGISNCFMPENPNAFSPM